MKLDHAARRCSYRVRMLPVVCTFVLLLASACRGDQVREVIRQVPTGMPMEEALRTAGAKAWYHATCVNQKSITDLFFYESHRYDDADIVIMNSVVKEGEYRVTHMGSFEPYIWQKEFADCIDEQRFER